MDTSRARMRDTVVGCLTRTPQQIEFIKGDGSTRILYGTLDTDLIPDEALAARPVDTPNPDDDGMLVRVFDLEINEWRGFRMERLEYFVDLTRETCPRSLRDRLFPTVFTGIDPNTLFQMLGGGDSAAIDDWI